MIHIAVSTDSIDAGAELRAIHVDVEDARMPSDRVMAIDASGNRYWTGHPGVVLVNDPLATVEEVARAYDIRWLVLERADGVPATSEILLDGRRPAWVGPPILSTEEVSVYPVCTAADDTRCAAAMVVP